MLNDQTLSIHVNNITQIIVAGINKPIADIEQKIALYRRAAGLPPLSPNESK